MDVDTFILVIIAVSYFVTKVTSVSEQFQKSQLTSLSHLLSIKCPDGVVHHQHSVGSNEAADTAEIAFFPLQLARESSERTVSQIPAETVHVRQAHPFVGIEYENKKIHVMLLVKEP